MTGGRLRYAVQLIATLAVLAWMPSNIGKLVAFLIVWALTFGPLTRAEWGLSVAVCALFTGMNAAALKQGIFTFTSPDVLGMPAYELAMWGFYVLHTRRMMQGPAPVGAPLPAWGLAIAFAACFATIHDSGWLLVASGAVVLAGLAIYREWLDRAYAGYMVLVGACIEYTGVLSGQWFYPDPPPGGVPWWFITMWGGVGLFLRRVALPLVVRFENQRA